MLPIGLEGCHHQRPVFTIQTNTKRDTQLLLTINLLSGKQFLARLKFNYPSGRTSVIISCLRSADLNENLETTKCGVYACWKLILEIFLYVGNFFMFETFFVCSKHSFMFETFYNVRNKFSRNNNTTKYYARNR